MHRSCSKFPPVLILCETDSGCRSYQGLKFKKKWKKWKKMGVWEKVVNVMFGKIWWRQGG